MTLSVFCLTNDPGARVAAIMRQLRPVAEESCRHTGYSVTSTLAPECASNCHCSSGVSL